MLRVQAAHLSHSLLSCWDDQRSAGSDSGLLLPLLSRWKGQPSLKGVYARGTLIRQFAPASGRLQGTPLGKLAFYHGCEMCSQSFPTTHEVLSRPQYLL